jgi:DNA-binding transcriptional ArsR family regulator
MRNIFVTHQKAEVYVRIQKGGVEDRVAAAVWRALANPERRRMLERLRAGPCTATDLAAASPTSLRPAVRRHVRLFEEAGLVDVEKVGRNTIHTYRPGPARAVLEAWLAAEP